MSFGTKKTGAAAKGTATKFGTKSKAAAKKGDAKFATATNFGKKK